MILILRDLRQWLIHHGVPKHNAYELSMKVLYYLTYIAKNNRKQLSRRLMAVRKTLSLREFSGLSVVSDPEPHNRRGGKSHGDCIQQLFPKLHIRKGEYSDHLKAIGYVWVECWHWNQEPQDTIMTSDKRWGDKWSSGKSLSYPGSSGPMETLRSHFPVSWVNNYNGNS